MTRQSIRQGAGVLAALLSFAAAVPPQSADFSSTNSSPGVQQSQGGGPNAQVAHPPDIPLNVIAIMMDDAGMCQLPQFDDLNRWPGSYPYPRMPFVNSVVSEGIRFTNVRVNPRCSPTRAAILSGRLGHITSNHPTLGDPGHEYGTGIGDVPHETPNTQVPFYEGLKSAHRPWPAVAKAAGAPHSIALFGKYHLFNYNFPEEVRNRRAPVDVAGFDESHEFSLSGIGAPLYGYYNFSYHFIDATTGSNTQAGQTILEGDPSEPNFSPSMQVEKLLQWVDAQIAAGRPFFANWWMNMPHGTLPAIEQYIGPNGEQLHSTYTQAELGFNPGVWKSAGADGLVRVTGAPILLYDIDGQNPHLVAATDNPNTGYTSEGGYNTLWRRARAMFECMDTLIGIVSDHLRIHHPAEFAKTVFILYSDNGANQTELTPRYTNEFSTLGSEYNRTIPPTLDGLPGGPQIYKLENQKGSAHEDGTRSPMLVWGSPLSPATFGTDCGAYIDAADFYGTFLDFLAPGDWKPVLGPVDIEKLDGESFHRRIFDAGPSHKEFTVVAVQRPGYQHNVQSRIWQFDRAIIHNTGWKLRSEFEMDDFPPFTVTTPLRFYLYNLNADPDESIDLFPLLNSGSQQLDDEFSSLISRYRIVFGI